MTHVTHVTHVTHLTLINPQVQYVLSDKTGTLTQNVMGFVWASIGGVMYKGSGGAAGLAYGDEAEGVEGGPPSSAPSARAMANIKAIAASLPRQPNHVPDRTPHRSVMRVPHRSVMRVPRRL